MCESAQLVLVEYALEITEYKFSIYSAFLYILKITKLVTHRH